MSVRLRSGGRAPRGVLLLVILVSISLLYVSPAQAQGGFALSGSFYAQEFELPQGSSLTSPEVYVVVFNNTDSDFKVRMLTDTPLGVAMLLSEDDFPLKAGEQRRVEVGVEVTTDAAPGEYEIHVTAEPYREGTSGIQIIGAAGQSARLVVVGEGARATVQIVSPEGTPVQGVVRLSKILAGKKYEVAYSETGRVEATVAPGSYAAAAYIAGEQLAEEGFELGSGDDRTVSLVVKTVYFESFGLVPSYRTGTQDLALAQIVYTIKNLYKPVETAEVVLKVSYNDAPLDEVSLATLSPLELGRMGLNYNYIPAAGWSSGIYGFRLELRIEGEPYASTAEEKLSVAGQANAPSPVAQAEPPSVTRRVDPPASAQPDVATWLFIVLLIGVLLLAAAAIGGFLLFILVARRRRRDRRRI